jgi:hypothetical protein
MMHRWEENQGKTRRRISRSRVSERLAGALQQCVGTYSGGDMERAVFAGQHPSKIIWGNDRGGPGKLQVRRVVRCSGWVESRAYFCSAWTLWVLSWGHVGIRTWDPVPKSAETSDNMEGGSSWNERRNVVWWDGVVSHGRNCDRGCDGCQSAD